MNIESASGLNDPEPEKKNESDVSLVDAGLNECFPAARDKSKQVIEPIPREKCDPPELQYLNSCNRNESII